ncbi:MAG: pantetheine-phosphate adenylyltransferase [Candidatus Saganbacteria bacterium]|nr:pantetheine-phosphate adenylyltransferase [Candidatus Saganbacteria bacterium]
MKIAVYPGSFDPITNGHLDIIERAMKIFDKIFIAVLRNPEKKQHFNLEDRLEMTKEAVKSIAGVEVESFEGLLVDYAVQKKACAIIRGLRAVSDFEYEFQLALTNAHLKPEIETVFLMTGSRYSYLSSSLVLQISSLGGDISDFVPDTVNKKIKGGIKWKY